MRQKNGIGPVLCRCPLKKMSYAEAAFVFSSLSVPNDNISIDDPINAEVIIPDVQSSSSPHDQKANPRTNSYVGSVPNTDMY